jgi:antirestriction protein ArdC
MSDVYSIITERIIHLLEQGAVPWHKPWQGGETFPRNLISRKPYRGVNVFLLHAMSFESPYWLTYKQARELGGNVRRGERACPVVFWKRLEVADQGEPTGKKQIPFLRYYSVFNSAQCEGIGSPPPVSGPGRDHNPIADAERIVSGMPKRPEIRHGLHHAFYSPSADIVGMPSPERFDRAEDYYSVLFHELTHATGHETRLACKQSPDGWEAFGSQSYSREELVAEMGAAFLCGQAGIIERTVDNSAAYLASWLKRLKDDTRLVVQAAAQAQRAADFILGQVQSESEVAA